MLMIGKVFGGRRGADEGATPARAGPLRRDPQERSEVVAIVESTRDGIVVA